jgi:hypothetical protein
MKRLYPENRVEQMMYDNNPLFAMLPKKYDSKGESWHRAIRYTPTAGRSASYSVAKANKAPSNVVKVLITTVEDYSLYSVNGKAIRSATGNGALVDIFTEEVDAAMDAMNRSYAAGVYGNGGGAIGRLTSGVTLSGTTATLNTIDDVVNFEKGMYLQLSATDGTSGSVKSGRTLVTAVDRDAGTLTVATAWSTAIPTAAASDYIFPEGDFGAKMKGLDAWIPSSAPSVSESFFGLDRSVDATRLAGVRVSASGLSIAEACKKGLQMGFRNGAKTTHIFMNDKRFLELDLELGSNKRWVDTTKAEIGFTGIEFVGHGGKPVEVYPDPNCPVNTIWGLNLSDWCLEGPSKFPFIEAYDGTKVVREASADAFSGEIKSYHQLVCKAPGRQWRAALT